MFQPLTWSGRPARWLYFSAILGLVLAGVFAVVGFLNPALRSGFYLTAAILGGLGFLLFLWARRMLAGYEEAQRLRVQGVPGTARIVALQQTGMYLNEQPQVELTLEVTSSMQVPIRSWSRSGCR
jgi:membrane protease YdiL (CAAX protease family)